MNSGGGTDIEILHLDGDCVAINKPAGLLMHRTRIDPDATEFAVQLTRDKIGQRIYPAHRLDRATSGVVIFGLNEEAAGEINRAFRERETVKRYVAMVRGYCEDRASITKPLRQYADFKSDVAAFESKSVQECHTEYTTLFRYELPVSDGRHETSRYSLVRIRLHTGRRHQIRRHFRDIAHPVVGDRRYGDRRSNTLFADQFGARRLLLVAQELQIVHPATGRPLRLIAPLGNVFENAIEGVIRAQMGGVS